MALTVKIPIEITDDPEVAEISRKLRDKGRVKDQVISIPIFDLGETLFTAEEYALCEKHNLICEDGLFYSRQLTTMMDNLIPIDWPDSKDAEGNRISFENYFRQGPAYRWDLEDGTTVFRVVRPDIALSDKDRKLFQKILGTLLVKSEGLATRPVPEDI